MLDDPKDWHDYIQYYVNELHNGNAENAYYSLRELDHTAVPQLIDAYYAESSLDIKIALLELIYAQRWPESLSFFADILQSNKPEIWKMALDGIWTINHQSGIDVLRQEKARLAHYASQANTERLEWIDEAIEQLTENLESLDL